jgi:hypothetical protein
MAEIALKIVQLIESAHTRCNLLYNSPVVQQILWQLRTASLCDRVVQHVVQKPHTRCDYRYNRRINLNRPTDCTTDRTVCGPLYFRGSRVAGILSCASHLHTVSMDILFMHLICFHGLVINNCTQEQLTHEIQFTANYSAFVFLWREVKKLELDRGFSCVFCAV